MPRYKIVLPMIIAARQVRKPTKLPKTINDTAWIKETGITKLNIVITRRSAVIPGPKSPKSLKAVWIGSIDFKSIDSCIGFLNKIVAAINEPKTIGKKIAVAIIFILRAFVNFFLAILNLLICNSLAL
jgi:hypothetical protein